MRLKKKIPVQLARVEEKIVDAGVTCDLCKKTIEDEHHRQDNEVTVEAKIGDVYPEGDFRKRHEADVCGACFMTKVVPALAAIGLVFRVRDVESFSNEDDGRVWKEPADLIAASASSALHMFDEHARTSSFTPEELEDAKGHILGRRRRQLSA